MKNSILLFLSLFSSSLFAQADAVAGQGNDNLIIWGLISVFVILLVSYIVALIKTQKGEMIVFVNKYDFILMFSSYVLLFGGFYLLNSFAESNPNINRLLYSWLIIGISTACVVTSMVWSILANNKNIKLGILAVLAKLFLMLIIGLVILLYIGYTARRTTKSENGQTRKLTDYEQMREDIDQEKRKALALKIVSFLFLSLIVGTAAYKRIMQKNNTDEEKVNNLIQNVDVKKLIYTFLAITFAVSLVGYGSSYLLQSEKNKTEILPDTSIDEEEDFSLESNSTAEFDEFFKRFNSDDSFQRSRIIFPIKITNIDVTADDISHEIITKDKWEFDKIEENSDYYYVVKKVKDNKATIWLSGKENGTNVKYFFEKRKDDWYLISIKDKSA